MYVRWAVAAIVVALCCAGCTSSALQGSGQLDVPPTSHHPDFPSTSGVISSPRPTTATPTTAAPTTRPPLTRADRIRVLIAQTNGAPHAVVAVPDGYEAATWDEHGDIQFWHNGADTVQWQQLGASRYPYIRALGPPRARAVGAHLRGMQHATYIVRGIFSGDASGNAVAFTTGPRGWGAIKAEPNGNIGPSGVPVGRNRIGLSFNFEFSGGYLVTQDCPTNHPVALCSRYAITKRWVWTGRDFRRVQ